MKFNYDELYTKEKIKEHCEDYEVAQKNLKYCRETIDYLKLNISCFKLYKAICFLHYNLKLDKTIYPLIILFKYKTNKAKKRGNDL